MKIRLRSWILAGQLALLVILSGPVVAAGSSQGKRPVTVEDMVLLLSSGISDQTILVFLTDRELDFTLTREVVLKLSQAGLTNAVMLYLKEKEMSAEDVRSGPSLVSYRSTGYSTYYDAGRISNSMFPLAWYGHYYYSGDHHAVEHDYAPVYHAVSGIDHSGAGSRHHEAVHMPHHADGLSGDTAHHSASLEHATRQDSVSHLIGHYTESSREHTNTRTGRHNVSHPGGSVLHYSSGSSGHGTRHRTGHTGIHSPGGHVRRH